MGSGWVDMTTATQTLTINYNDALWDISGIMSATFKCESDTAAIFDTYTIAKLYDGDNAINVINSEEQVTVNLNYGGSVPLNTQIGSGFFTSLLWINRYLVFFIFLNRWWNLW